MNLTESKSQAVISQPHVKNYMSATDYLTDHYQYRKRLDSKFSYEIWAAELGLKSKSTLRLVCIGDKFISNLFTDIFSENANLGSTEKEYLTLLANHRNCKDPSLKKVFLNRIIESCDHTGNQTQMKDYSEFLASAELPVLQMTLAFSDFEASVSNLQKILNWPEELILKRLKKLESLGIAESYFSDKTQEQCWKSLIKHFRITSTLKQEALNAFHIETTKEAAAIIPQSDLLKKFRSLFFSLSEDSYQEASNDIEEFITKLKNKYGNEALSGKKLYKVNLQAYPVTK